MGNIDCESPELHRFFISTWQDLFYLKDNNSWPWIWNWLHWAQGAAASPSSTASTPSPWLPKAWANIQWRKCAGASPGTGDSTTRIVEIVKVNGQKSLCCAGLGAADTPTSATSSHCWRDLTQHILSNISFILLTPQISFLSAKSYHMQLHICEAVGSRSAR